MNNKDAHQSAANAVSSEAIDRVLQAEQAAQQAVAQCEREAENIVRAAQMQVQRINQRVDKRITWVQMRCARWLSEQSRQLSIADRAQEADADAMPERDVTELVKALAARLSGEDTEAP